MEIYIVERTDKVGYDETESMVVVAKDEKQARETASKECWKDYSYDDNDIVVTKIELKGESRRILSNSRSC